MLDFDQNFGHFEQNPSLLRSRFGPNFGNFHQIRSFLNNAQNFDDQTARNFVQNVGDL